MRINTRGTGTCPDCGKKITPFATRCKPCHDVTQKAKTGEQHPCWQGGRWLSGGYVMVRTGPSKHRAEHVLIAETILRRRLKKGEVVHHVNGVKADNRGCNLVICTQSYHRELHERMGALYQREHFGRVA